MRAQQIEAYYSENRKKKKKTIRGKKLGFNLQVFPKYGSKFTKPPSGYLRRRQEDCLAKGPNALIRNLKYLMPISPPVEHVFITLVWINTKDQAATEQVRTLAKN